MRYIDVTLAAYVGEEVTIRYDPRDMAEIRVFYKGTFLCRAVSQEIAGHTISLKDIIKARNKRKKFLRDCIKTRKEIVDLLVEIHNENNNVNVDILPHELLHGPTKPINEERPPDKLKRYLNE